MGFNSRKGPPPDADAAAPAGITAPEAAVPAPEEDVAPAAAAPEDYPAPEGQESSPKSRLSS